MRLAGAIPLMVVVCLSGAAVAQHVTHPADIDPAFANPPAVRPPAAHPPVSRPAAARPQHPAAPPPSKTSKAKPVPSADKGAAKATADAINAGTPDVLERLAKLSPEQRNRALAALPPARRAKILQQLSDYLKMRPEERAKVLDRYHRMQALPPQKRAQVRVSLQQFAGLPQPRKALVRRQLNLMKGLSDSDRRTMMNSEEFRSKFTASEQRMIGDIASVTPGEY